MVGTKTSGMFFPSSKGLDLAPIPIAIPTFHLPIAVHSLDSCSHLSAASTWFAHVSIKIMHISFIDDPCMVPLFTMDAVTIILAAEQRIVKDCKWIQ